MANIIGKEGVILKVDAVPSAGGGTPAPVGSVAEFGSSLYIKTAAANTAWTAVGGLSSTPFTTKTANYTIQITDSIIFVDTSGGPFNLTLPNPATVTLQPFSIIDIAGTLSTNNLTLVRFAAEKIEGLAASKVFFTDWGGWNIYTNQVDWFIK